MFLLELVEEVVDECDIEVLTTKVSVTVGGLHLENTLLHLQNGDIESTTTEIVDSDYGAVCTVQTISKGSSRGLVDDTQDVKASNLTGVFCGLALGVIEVCRDSDDSVATDAGE